MKHEDLTGKCFHNLKVIRDYKPHKSRQRKLTCICKCGRIKDYYKQNVKRGLSTKCNICALSKIKIGTNYDKLIPVKVEKSKVTCLCECGRVDKVSTRYLTKGKNLRCKYCRYHKKYSEKSHEKRAEALIRYIKQKSEENSQALINKKFGMLKVLGFSFRKKQNRFRKYLICKCECGNMKEVRAGGIGKDTFSCGCFQKKRVRSGEENHLSKVTDKQSAMIIKLIETGIYTCLEISEILGVSIGCVYYRKQKNNKSKMKNVSKT